MKGFAAILLILGCTLALDAQSAPQEDASRWTVFITNDACSDYTWGFNETQTRRAFADVVRAHLDEMLRTDSEASESRDRYNMSVTQEADAFLEFYPERKDELIRRVREGRVFIGPVYDNALWGFQSTEGMIRAFYPARRLQRQWGFPMDVVAHGATWLAVGSRDNDRGKRISMAVDALV